jgi:hypothetical protein
MIPYFKFRVDFDSYFVIYHPLQGTCQICFERGMLLGLTCAHLFCADCWNQYLGQAVRHFLIRIELNPNSKYKLIEQVIAEGRVHVLCPAERCTVAVDEDFARARLAMGGSKTLEQFAHIQLNSFVEVTRLEEQSGLQ